MAKGCVSLLLGVGFGLGSLAVVLASPQGNGVPHNVALHGQVRTKDGRVIPVGVTATLQTRGGVPVESRPADSNGNFEFSGLTAGYYILSVKAEKFQIFEQSLDICDGWIV